MERRQNSRFWRENSSPVKLSRSGTRSTHPMFLLPKPLFRSSGSNTNNNNKLLDFLNNVQFHCLPQANIFTRFLVVVVCFCNFNKVVLLCIWLYSGMFPWISVHFYCQHCFALSAALTDRCAIENTIRFSSLQAFLDASSLSLWHSTMQLRCGNESSTHSQ